jgi:hypothetical protein
MPRGGKREGAGRKRQGITRKVSLTLTSEEWKQIESSGKTVAAFMRQLMRKMATTVPTQSHQAVTGYERRHAEERWQIYLNNTDQQHAEEALTIAKDALFRLLFPKGAEVAQVETKTQYICPFSGKRFGSMDSLIRAAIPRLITNAEIELRRKQERMERKRSK